MCNSLRFVGLIHWWEVEKDISFDSALVLDTDLLEWHDERYNNGGGIGG